MTEIERPLKDRLWEATKDLSVKVSKKAEKHWKINRLRVEIASIKHRINIKYKEVGRYVFESHKAGILDEESFRTSASELFAELQRFEEGIAEREERIEFLEREVEESATDPAPPPPPVPTGAVEDVEEEGEPAVTEPVKAKKKKKNP